LEIFSVATTLLCMGRYKLARLEAGAYACVVYSRRNIEHKAALGLAGILWIAGITLLLCIAFGVPRLRGSEEKPPKGGTTNQVPLAFQRVSQDDFFLFGDTIFPVI